MLNFEHSRTVQAGYVFIYSISLNLSVDVFIVLNCIVNVFYSILYCMKINTVFIYYNSVL